jgi:hypothetical protein
VRAGITTYSPPPSAGAVKTTRFEISRADPRTGRLADGGAGGTDGCAVEAPGVASGVIVADVEPSGPDARGVVTGAGLVVDVQAAARRATTIVVVKRESEGHISMSSGTVCPLRRLAVPLVTSTDSQPGHGKRLR